MSTHDVNPIDGEFAGLVAELRATAPAAPPELRRRVHEVAERPPVSRWPALRPRLVWALAPLGAAAVAAAVVVAVEGHPSSRSTAVPQPSVAALDRTAKAPEALSSAAGKAAIAPGARAQLYEAQLTLRVDDLSAKTQSALRETRHLGGYLRSVDYGSGTDAGTADLVVRVPIQRVQQAIVGFSELGKILDQHVSVRDVQTRIDRRFARISELRTEIQSLSGDERERAEAELTRLVQAQARDRQRTSFATVSLHLRTKEAATVVPATPTRIERALERATDVVSAELAALVYVLLVAGPFLLVGAALMAVARALRRRSDARLMA